MTLPDILGLHHRAPSGGSSRQRLRRGLSPACAAHGPMEIPRVAVGIVERWEPLGNQVTGRLGSRRVDPAISLTAHDPVLLLKRVAQEEWAMPSRRRFIALSSASAGFAGLVSVSALGQANVINRNARLIVC